ncbi:MAG TPA: NHL repeat-containing protein [Solirubrobacterales bacterium]|nr:NHL repeat-containing protein [Solirubrobacterales bacterium]
MPALWRSLAVLILALAATCASAVPALGAASDPLFIFRPVPSTNPKKQYPPPSLNFNGPCGLGVDSAGNFYVSDYYRHTVSVFTPDLHPETGYPFYLGQLQEVDPLSGPCGLAFDAADNLYVNSYHRSVIEYGSKAGFGTGTAIAGAGVDSTHPTGVAVDPASGNVYVDARTHIAVYDSTGAPVMEGSEPLRIGLGDLVDGYGVAFSQHPATLGRLYVPDAATATVKVYDPAVDTVAPVAEIDGSATPEGRFVSLRDAAIAVDRVSGDVYVVDNLQPLYAEQPTALVYVFGPDGSYKGHLKYLIRDALPAGLAVDNSATATQGRVYVTSGNTEGAGVYAYPPGAATTAAPKPTTFAIAAPSAPAELAPAAEPVTPLAGIAPLVAAAPAAQAATPAAKRRHRVRRGQERRHQRRSRHSATKTRYGGRR